MSYIIPTDDQLSIAMMQGILDAFKADLRKQLQKEADVIIERTIEELSKRVKAKIESADDYVWQQKRIHLSWCLKKEGGADE